MSNKVFYPRYQSTTAANSSITSWSSWTPDYSCKCDSKLSSLSGAVSPAVIYRYDPVYQGNQLPAGAIITGIKVYFWRAAEEASTTNFVKDYDVRLVTTGQNVSPQNKADTSTKWPFYVGGFPEVIFGGSSDTWGLSSSALTGDNFNEGFELRVKVSMTCNRTNFSAYSQANTYPNPNGNYTARAVVYYDEPSSDVPVIHTEDPSDIDYTTAESGGYGDGDRGDILPDIDLESKGIEWINLSNSAYDSDIRDNPSNRPFAYTMTGLTPGTDYKVRARATNRYGPGYGTWKYFTTLGTSLLPVVSTITPDNITAIEARSGVHIINANGTINQKGIVWSTSFDPTTTNNMGILGESTTDPSDAQYTMTGLTPGTLYYARAFVVNASGTGYGISLPFTTLGPTLSTYSATLITNTSAFSGGYNINANGLTIATKGICWNTSGTPVRTDPHNSIASSTTDPFTLSAVFLSAGTTYYARAYVITTNGITAYGNQISFTTTINSVPTLSTYPADYISQTQARSGGYDITANGTISVIGICWNTTGSPTISDSHTAQITNSTDNFRKVATSLNPGTTYYLKAYATNENGPGYGSNEITFITDVPTPEPSVGTVTVDQITTTSGRSGGANIILYGHTLIEKGVKYKRLVPVGPEETTSIVTEDSSNYRLTMSPLTPSSYYAYWAYILTDNGINIGSIYYFYTDAEPAGIVKVYNGSQWEIVPTKKWNGSSWETISAKYFNGSSWTT